MYEDDLREVFLAETLLDRKAPALSERALRSLLSTFRRIDIEPDDGMVTGISTLLSHDDWGIRADAVRVVRHWEELADALTEPEEGEFEIPGLKYPALRKLIRPLVKQIEKMLKTETDPHVLFVCKEET